MPRPTRRACHSCLSVLFLAVVLLVAPGTSTAQEVEHPLARSKLSLSDRKPERRRVAFKARFEAQEAMENPSFAGSTLRIAGASPTDGDSGLIQLAPSRWHALGNPAGSKGYRYEDESGAAAGIRRILVKVGKRRGVFKVVGNGSSWPYAITGAQSGVTLTFTIGDDRWCAEFKTFAKNVKGRVVAKSNAAPATCPCDRFDSTWAAIQSQVLEKRGCTQLACHGSSPGQGALDLRADVAHANLIDRPSSLPGLDLVEPGDQSKSFFWLKLAKGTSPDEYQNVPGVGMPNGFPPLPASELEAVRLWIRAGGPETGVVTGTEDLLASCLPPPDPIKIRRPDPPPADLGIQLHAPPWEIAAGGEDEVCYATYYDFSATIPASAQAPCPDFWGGPSKQCFFHNRNTLTQDPNSHHSIIHYYKGAWDIDEEIWTCQGGPDNGTPCAGPGRAAVPPKLASCGEGGTCTMGRSAFGPFKCLGGTNAGQDCDPRAQGTCPGGGCAGRVQSGVGCIFYGPPDYGFDITGSGSDNAPQIGGSQQPLLTNAYPPGVFAMLPVKGTMVWNSHAFNLTDEPATNEQFFDLYFASATDRTYQVRGIFDSRDIFVQNVPPFQQDEYCRTYTLPKGARLFQLSSHTHKRGKLFRIWGPGITDRCGCGAGAGGFACSENATHPKDCPPEPGPPIFTTVHYDDPTVLYFDPPLELDQDDPSTRTLKFCSLYDNGATVPSEVKRRSTSPRPPFRVPGLEAILGGPCPNATVACLDGPKKGQLCGGDNAVCDSQPGLGDGLCDACPVHGGVTTEDEMFILLGLYYVVP
jgi:hypothetical protein